MKQVEKFFGLKPGETQVCNGFVFVCTDKKVLTQGAAPTVYGTLTTPAGEVVDYTQKGVFANKLNKLAGVANSVTIPAKVDNSQQKGENKVVAVSDNKLARQHRAVMQALATINKVLGYQDSANMAVQASWYEYSKEQHAIAERLRIEAEAKAKAKAEAEAKAKAEAQAKLLQQAVAELKAMVEKFVECGMSYKQAEQFARNNPKYTDEQKEAAFGK